MDYNSFFEKDINQDFSYTNYPGNKLIVGRLSLEKAKARMSKNEYYVLVTYKAGEVLPPEYILLNEYSKEDTLFATVNPSIHFNYMCVKSGARVISNSVDEGTTNPKYFINFGPVSVSLIDLVKEQYSKYMSTSMTR